MVPTSIFLMGVSRQFLTWWGARKRSKHKALLKREKRDKYPGLGKAEK